MSYNITGKLRIFLNLLFEKVLDLSVAEDNLTLSAQLVFTYGTGANQINKIYHETRVLADGANATLNLYDSGTLKDSFGNDLAISALKLLYIKNNSADATLLLFGGNSADIPICSNANDQIKIKPGGIFPWIDLSAAGTVISTNKNLRIEHDGTGTETMAVDIIVGGI